MKNKIDYFDSDDIELDKYRKKRSGKRKRKKAGKVILTIISLIVIALATFFITVKIAKPDYDFSNIVPKDIVSTIDEKIKNYTNSEPSTVEDETTKATTTTTTVRNLDYLDFDEFDFKTSVQGNYLGNLLNGGKVGTDMTYIYHIVDGKGIYRFNPSTEEYTVCYKTSDKLESLNLRGDYFYFVNKSNDNLYKLQKGTSKPKLVAENVKVAYVYDSTVYFVTNDNRICTMDVKGLTPITLYNAADKQLDLVGISLTRVFFTVTDDYNNVVEYRTVDSNADEVSAKFRDDTAIGDIKNPVMENGFLYYFEKQTDGDYNLCRQKFGSDKVVTLVKNVSPQDYVTVDSNRLYYSEISNGKYRMREYNMNSGDDKCLLSVSNADDIKYQHGGEYDFIIGDGVYKASCIYTSSTNVMKLKNGKWSY